MGLALWTTFLAYSWAISLVVLRQLEALPTSRFSVSLLVVLRKIYRLSNHNLVFIPSGARSSFISIPRVNCCVQIVQCGCREVQASYFSSLDLPCNYPNVVAMSTLFYVMPPPYISPGKNAEVIFILF